MSDVVNRNYDLRFQIFRASVLASDAPYQFCKFNNLVKIHIWNGRHRSCMRRSTDKLTAIFEFDPNKLCMTCLWVEYTRMNPKAHRNSIVPPEVVASIQLPLLKPPE